MKSLMFKIALTAVVAVGVGVVQAQDMVEVTETAQAGSEQSSVVEQMDPDNGPEIVREAEVKQPEVKEAEKDIAESEKFVPAAESVKTILKKQLGLRTGYDRKRKAVIVIGEAEMYLEDPATDKAFMNWRMLKAMEAYLNAKAEIIRSINNDVKGVDRVACDFSEGGDDVAQVYQEKKAAFEAKKAELAKKLALLDEKEADALAGVTITDRFGAMMDALIKKLDKEYNKETITAEKQAAYEKVKAECASLTEEYKSLEKDAKNFPKYPQNELQNDVTMISKMPVLGASVLLQAESWDKNDKTYSVAMAVVWSPKMQNCAFKLMQGDLKADVAGQYSLEDWLDQQYLPSMVGSRRITDNEGNVIFMGIAAEDISGSVMSRKAKRAQADVDAVQMVARALCTDLDAYRGAQRVGKEYRDDLKTAKQKLTEVTTSKYDLNLKGCVRLTSQECEHPISGKKTYVTVYYIDPELNREATKILEKSYADAGLATKTTQYTRGLHAGHQKALEGVRQSKEEFNRGVTDGKKVVDGAIKKAETAHKSAVKRGSVGAAGSSESKKSATSKGGTFTGDAAVDTNF